MPETVSKFLIRSMKRSWKISRYRRVVRSMKIRSEITKHKRNKLNNPHMHRRSLNDIPDAILWHMLSFLPTDLAVRASVLSKRWRYLWASLPHLDFYDRNIADKRERKKFIAFVERVLRCHNAPCIKKFLLSCWVRDDVLRINKWISTALSHNLQEFDIFIDELHVGDLNVLPHSLFTCKTLQVLKLHARVEFSLPPQICLPNLKKLSLMGLSFKDHRELNLLFASSALEELVIDDFVWEGESHGEVIISAPKLRSLIINESEDEILRVATECSVTISAPITTFYHSGEFIKDFRFSYPSSIGKATIIFWHSDEVNPDSFPMELRSFQFVKCLKLSNYALEGLSDETVPIFEKLTSLKITGNSVDLSRKELEIFLKKCPCIESLKLPDGISVGKFDVDRLLSPNFTCLSSLKKITIRIVGEDMEELIAVHVLLVKATSLETMNIVFSHGISLSERAEIMVHLSDIPKGSSSCKVFDMS